MSDHLRRQLSAGLIRAVREADSRPDSIGTRIPIRHEAVHECRVDLLELAERLLAPEPIDAAGVVLVTALVEDPSSPLYQHGGDLAGAVRDARRALDGSAE